VRVGNGSGKGSFNGCLSGSQEVGKEDWGGRIGSSGKGTKFKSGNAWGRATDIKLRAEKGFTITLKYQKDSVPQ